MDPLGSKGLREEWEGRLGHLVTYLVFPYFLPPLNLRADTWA